MRTVCPECGQKYEIEDADPGQELQCVAYGTTFPVPDPVDLTEAAVAQAVGDTVSPADAERIPCPICAERIMPEARKCRFCGHWLGAGEGRGPSGVTRPDRSWPGVLCVVAFVLSTLSMPVSAVLFLLVFRMSRLTHCMAAGGCLAFAGVVVGVVGIVASRGTKSTMRTLGALGIGVGAFAGVSTVSYAVLTGFARKKVGAMGDTPVARAVEHMLGSDEAAAVRMKCGACGEEFESSMMEYAGQQMSQVMALYSGGDADEVLNKLDELTSTGVKCPKCGEPAGEPMLTCTSCKRHFDSPDGWLPGTAVSCPHCGHKQSPAATGILDLSLPGLEDPVQ